MIDLTIREFFQVLSMMVLVFGVYSQLNHKHRDPIGKGNMIALVTLFTHGILFYVVTLLRTAGYLNIDNTMMTNWSSGLRFHSFFTIVLLEYSRDKLEKFLNKHKGGGGAE